MICTAKCSCRDALRSRVQGLGFGDLREEGNELYSELLLPHVVPTLDLPPRLGFRDWGLLLDYCRA